MFEEAFKDSAQAKVRKIVSLIAFQAARKAIRSFKVEVDGAMRFDRMRKIW